MRTKEIKVWVSPSDLGNKYFSVAHESADCPMKGDSVKARLIIDLPDKKIEITESQFDEAIGHIDARTEFLFVPAIGDLLKQRLFGKEGV